MQQGRRADFRQAFVALQYAAREQAQQIHQQKIGFQVKHLLGLRQQTGRNAIENVVKKFEKKNYLYEFHKASQRIQTSCIQPFLLF